MQKGCTNKYYVCNRKHTSYLMLALTCKHFFCNVFIVQKDCIDSI